MDTDSLLKIILLGFWVPFFFIGLLYFYLKYFFQRIVNRRKHYEAMNVKDSIDQLIYRLDREFELIRSALSSSVDGISEELPNKILHKLSNQIENELDKYTSKLLEIPINRIDREEKVADISSNETLIREMSHFLNTPLSQIEASLVAIEATTDSDNNQKDNLSEDINAVKSSVNMCKSFLAAYRELILVAKSAKTWVPDSLKDSILSASNLYIKKSNKNINGDGPICLDSLRGELSSEPPV